MAKERKLHQFTGIIKHCFPGLVTNKKSPHKGRPFYILEIEEKNVFSSSRSETIYVFSNLVSKDVWKVLEQENYQSKVYHFFCERRVRGWRLKEMEEVSNYQKYAY